MKDPQYKRPFPSRIYRSIRKGMIVLPEMERRLMIDLHRLSSMIRGEVLSGFELTYAVESIETVREVLAETLDAYRALEEFLSPHVLDDLEHFERLLKEYVPEVTPEMTQELVDLMRRYGGVRKMLDQATGSLEARHEVLVAGLRRIEEARRESLVAALADLEAGYLKVRGEYPKWSGSMELHDEAALVVQWKKLLQDAQDAIANATSYWDREDAEDAYMQLLKKLCYEYPTIAEKLGLRAPTEGSFSSIESDLPCDRLYRNEVICMLICGPLMCAVVIVIMIMCSRDCQG